MRGLATTTPGSHAWINLFLAGARTITGLLRRLDENGRAVHSLSVLSTGPEIADSDHPSRAIPSRGLLRSDDERQSDSPATSNPDAGVCLQPRAWLGARSWLESRNSIGTVL